MVVTYKGGIWWVDDELVYLANAIIDLSSSRH